MNLIPAYRASEEDLEQFFEKNNHVKKDSLLLKGHVVEINEKIEGCFVLEEMEEGVFWLKQLYITQTEAAKLPFLLDAILMLAKKKQAKKIYVHSHQPVVDLLLEALQFNPQKGKVFVDKYNANEGNWWSYSVS
ncbi:GNAT family N-acetyltransferase [Virgibacillus ainsalahensis]